MQIIVHLSIEEDKLTRIPFDFCDECGQKFQISEYTGLTMLCKECRTPENWKPAFPPDDDYDPVTKREDDR